MREDEDPRKFSLDRMGSDVVADLMGISRGITIDEFYKIARECGLDPATFGASIKDTGITLIFQNGALQYGICAKAVAIGNLTREVLEEYLNRLSDFALAEPDFAKELDEEFTNIEDCLSTLEKTKIAKTTIFSNLFIIGRQLPIKNVFAMKEFIAAAREVNHVITDPQATK